MPGHRLERADPLRPDYMLRHPWTRGPRNRRPRGGSACGGARLHVVATRLLERGRRPDGRVTAGLVPAPLVGYLWAHGGAVQSPRIEAYCAQDGMGAHK